MTRDLVERVFQQFEAPDYVPEGVAEFLKYIDLAAIEGRQQEGNHFILVCRFRDQVVGMIEMRDFQHICLLFVDSAYQRKGIAHRLLKDAKQRCLEHDPSLEKLSVNSSPFAIPVYERLGFHAVQEEQLVNGIRYTPMELQL